MTPEHETRDSRRVGLAIAAVAAASLLLCGIMVGVRFAARYRGPLSVEERRLVGAWTRPDDLNSGETFGLDFSSDRLFRSRNGQFVGRWWIDDGMLHVRYWTDDSTQTAWGDVVEEVRSSTEKWPLRFDETGDRLTMYGGADETEYLRVSR